MKYFFVFLVVFLTRFLTCAAPVVTSEDPVVEPEQPTRNSVRRDAIRAKEWRLVYLAETEKDKARLREMLEEIARKQPLDKLLTVVDFAEISPAELGEMPLVLVGNKLPKELVALTGELSEDGVYNGVSVAEKGDLLQLRYIQNPWVGPDTTIGMNLIYGPDITSLQEQINGYYQDDWTNLFWNDWDFELSKAGKPSRKGSFIENGWVPNPILTLDLDQETEVVYADENWKMYAIDGTPTQGKLTQLAEVLTRTQSVVNQLFEQPSRDTASVYIYPTVERIGLRRKNMEEVQFDATDRSLHLVVSADEDLAFEPILEYQLMKWQHGDQADELPKEIDFIEAGLAVRSNVNRSFYHNAGIVLAKENKLFDLDVLSDRERRGDKSSYLYDIAAAAWVGAMLGEDEALLSPKIIATLKSKALAKSNHNWQAIIAKKAIATPSKIKEPTGFRKGMTFAHEGYRTYNGYGGSTVDPSLDSLAKLKVNAISIVPYTSQRDKNKVDDLSTSTYSGGENDQAVIYSIQRAHRRGWSVMLKPQIWVGNAWPGEVDFATEEEWKQFFTRYTEWIAHYAIMAQLEGVDALCIGTELVRATIDHPQEWRELIALLRNLYGGRLTYAANWGEEFENLTFWDDLDAIGLNSYYPLSEKEEPTDAELLQGAQKWVLKAETIAKKFNKNWWLTEVGFRSVKRAWLNPHAAADSRPASLDCQQRCFRSLATALQDSNHFTGMYIWKWPSYLGYGRRRRDPGTEFTPGGKPAASEVRAFYGKL